MKAERAGRQDRATDANTSIGAPHDVARYFFALSRHRHFTLNRVFWASQCDATSEHIDSQSCAASTVSRRPESAPRRRSAASTTSVTNQCQPATTSCTIPIDALALVALRSRARSRPSWPRITGNFRSGESPLPLVLAFAPAYGNTMTSFARLRRTAALRATRSRMDTTQVRSGTAEAAAPLAIGS
jgi:hypothetical protein